MSCSLCFIIFSVLLNTQNLTAQTYADSSLTDRIIGVVRIYGNKKTKAPVILREMKQKIGEPLDPYLLEEDRKRIQNLNLFNRVIITVSPAGEEALIQISVTEKWFFLPYPILFMNERDWSKLSYGAGLTHVNFRGRAETLNGLFWLGYNPSIQMAYGNPWIGGKHHLAFQASVYYQRVLSKHYVDQEVFETYIGGEAVIGKRFGYHTFFNIHLGYKELTFKPSVAGETLMADGRDRLPSLKLSLILDHRDLREYPRSGWYLTGYVLKTGFPSTTIDYLWSGFDGRIYIPLGIKPTLAFRTMANFSSGVVPVYHRTYFGYNERVRGHFFEISEGENRALASIALRFPILPIRFFDLSSHPQLSNLKFGISMALFADTGLTWMQGERVHSSKCISGYGLGIHFHLPYVNVLRFELAFNEFRKAEFIVDLNVDI
jgi:outer membrane protein assembly factor BamA